MTISLTVSQDTAHLNISDIHTFTVWCQRFSVFFTRLALPTDVNIPPVVRKKHCISLHTLADIYACTHPTCMHTSTHAACIHMYTHTHTHCTHTHTMCGCYKSSCYVIVSTQAVAIPPSCIQLNNDFQVFWTHTDVHIKIRQCGCVGAGNSQAFCVPIYCIVQNSGVWQNSDYKILMKKALSNFSITRIK